MAGWRTLVLATVVLAIAATAASESAAGGSPSEAVRPTIVLAERVLRPGDRVVARLAGWRARVVTVSVCGNLARRGSADCNLVASLVVDMGGASSKVVNLDVAAPPVVCPCVVRASSTAQDQVAVAPVDLHDVAAGPVVTPGAGPLVDLRVTARPAHRDLTAAIRSSLGGPTRFRVTVTVRNLTEETLQGLTVAGTAMKGGIEEVGSLRFAVPASVNGGETWQEEQTVVLPAPGLGSVRWNVVAAGAGPAVRSEVVTRRVPVALIVLTAVLVGDVTAWGIRVVRRRRYGSSAPDATGAAPVPSGVAMR